MLGRSPLLSVATFLAATCHQVQYCAMSSWGEGSLPSLAETEGEWKHRKLPSTL